MTIGEKITQLRTNMNMSQEQLAEKVTVSRQSVSKWEMDQAMPQIDKVLLMCSLFGITTDELLQDDIALVKRTREKNKYFGIPAFVMNDFMLNVDLETGIVFDSSEAQASFDIFKKKHEISDVKGNIFVAGR